VSSGLAQFNGAQNHRLVPSTCLSKRDLAKHLILIKIKVNLASMTAHDALIENEVLAPFWPALYVGWADGTLDAAELREVKNRIRKVDGLDSVAHAQLDAWLDADNPPTTTHLLRLLRRLRERAASLPEGVGPSMLNLGGSAQKGLDAEAIQRARAELEHVLGASGAEGLRAALPRTRPVPQTLSEVPAFEGVLLRSWLEAPYAELREEIRRFVGKLPPLSDPELTKAQLRERVREGLLQLAAAGYGDKAYPGALDKLSTLAEFASVFETLAFFDQSLVVKFGVQFGLFGGSIYFLGTRHHHRTYLPDVARAKLLGGFAMTELGHGSNVQELETTATWDSEGPSFIINTPEESARKEWIGNAACDGRMMTVFAQLQIGEESYGVHAFLVPVRDSAGELLPGVRIEDCGHKMGLNGVDNGRIWFDHVRIPCQNLLNRFGDVDASGNYTSSISNPGARFFAMLRTLVGGRVCIANAALSVSKLGLTIALRYAMTRRQFGPAAEAEQLILDYPTHQRRLMPKLATTFALHCALRKLTADWSDNIEKQPKDIESRAAGLKCYSTWHAIETLQLCREGCGGQGYLSVNRLGQLKADIDVFATFEGDNFVLMQLVAKSLLGEFRHQFPEMNLRTLTKWIMTQAAHAWSEFSPIQSRQTDDQDLLDSQAHLETFRYRERDLLYSLAKRIQKRLGAGKDSFLAFTECQNHAVRLAHAHIERLILEAFIESVASAPTELKDALTKLAHLFALSRIEDDIGWFLEHEYVAGAQAKAIRKMVIRLCREVRPMTSLLVDAFAIPDALVKAPIAQAK